MRDSIEEQGEMTPEMAAALATAQTLAEVEDIYRPYKPKRKTRAPASRRPAGWSRWRQRLLEQAPADEPAQLAAGYNGEEVPDAEAALAGARDIMAEAFHDDGESARHAAKACTSPTAWWSRRRQRTIPKACIRILRFQRACEKGRGTAFWQWTAASARAF